MLSAEECADLKNAYAVDARYRSTVVMQRHGFGRGEYQYFSYPLPDQIAQLRGAFYEQLIEVANDWQVTKGRPTFPDEYDAFLSRCASAGQGRPTPFILRYGPGDYNRLHQDLYGEHVFPLQMAILLSEPGRDFEGGEFVLTEQKPRSQSRADVVPLRRGEGVIFAVNERPAKGSRGFHTVRMRHGVSEVRTGERYALGIIAHDAA